MKTKLLSVRHLSLCAALSLGCQMAPAAEPANPKTTAPARAILDYFALVQVVPAPPNCLVPDVIMDTNGVLHMVYGNRTVR